MATPEFRETGRTENQRIHTDEQTRPRTGDRFAREFLERNPDVEGFAKGINAARAGISEEPAPQLPADLTDAELLDLTQRLLDDPLNTMSVESGAEVSRLIAKVFRG